MTTESKLKTENLTQEEFDRAFSDLLILPAKIAQMRRQLRELEHRQQRAQEIVNKAKNK